MSSSTSQAATTSDNPTTTSKDNDVALWLHNRLGSHADLWSSFSISSTLTKEHLLSIKSILWSLDTLMKVKLLLSFIHIPKRNITEWETLLKEIIDLTHQDNTGDQWIAIISEIMKTFPDRSSFNLDLSDQECEGYSDGIQDLRKTVKKNNDTTHLPLESCYLGRSALKVLTGDIPNPPRCFSLIRKAKSARVRQDLLEKSAQTPKTKKTSEYAAVAGTRRSVDENPSYYSSQNFPSKPMNFGFLKSSPISSTLGIIGASRSQPRREGNVKLLSLEEEKALNDKKRKKPTDDDESLQDKKSNRNKKALSQQQQQQQQSGVERSDDRPIDSNIESSTLTTTPGPQDPLKSHHYDQFAPYIAPAAYPPLGHNEMLATPYPVMNNAPNDPLYGLQQPRVDSIYSTTMHPNPELDGLQNTSPLRTDLKLSEEQSAFAHDLFRTSPCLSRADKNRILNFIAGVRDRSADMNKTATSNPIVTIKLSEQDETITDSNTGQIQQYFAETFFQMNTDTGEWKRIKKLRPLDSRN